MTDRMDTTKLRKVLARMQEEMLTLKDQQIEIQADLINLQTSVLGIAAELGSLIHKSTRLTEIIGFEDDDWQKVANRVDALKTKENTDE